MDRRNEKSKIRREGRRVCHENGMIRISPRTD